VNLTLKQLRAFAAVAELGSFAGAADRLQLTPSALSLLIKQLEDTLGQRLIERGHGRTTLARAGTDLLPKVNDVLGALEEGIASVRQLRDQARGQVRIACTMTYGSRLIPPLIAAYRQRFPGIDIQLLDGVNDHLPDRVSSGEADFCLTQQRPRPIGLTEQTVFDDDLVVLCPPNHPLAALDHPTWKDATQYPFIMIKSGTLQSELHTFSPSLTLQTAYEVSVITTALGMVDAGLGLAVLGAKTARLMQGFDLVTVKLRDPFINRKICAYTRRDETLSPAAQGFLDFIRDSMADADPSPSSPADSQGRLERERRL
jgi:DNA-binding transcriptional LysR family regulator